ncbi:hypothetical protein ABVK25_008439 [Lepraria finkii]|uniref:C2H2-type domain-containing protein n=1 Tax=Lepraria finkii TaxID=1340010 RepID=A0ABR4B0G0_9LECA
MQAMKAQFQQAAPQPAPQPMESIKAPEYHYCKLCKTSFSLTARLIRYTQESNCNKPVYNRCNQIFTSRNQLYKYLHTKFSAANPAATLPLPQKQLSTPATPPATLAPRYRIILPPPPAYKAIKDYLTVKNLYIRYTPLRATNKYIPPYLRISNLSQLFGRRSATAKSMNSATASTASTTSIKTTASAASAASAIQ